jgi:hypothetical protein
MTSLSELGNIGVWLTTTKHIFMFPNRYSVNKENICRSNICLLTKCINYSNNMSILREYAIIIHVRTCDNISMPEELWLLTAYNRSGGITHPLLFS